MTRPTLTEQWTEKMPPETFEERWNARRRQATHDRITAGGWVMLGFAIALWLYLAVMLIAWWLA